ncbi:pyridoxamine 5'-phosphate oxidase family protein [Dongshaea marina]|uniref:pyridoxamine 5'-phosphate oxidase family protein n=1 Tax=Dongshaea marina TaxID=2047966 RepID=UPI000D3E0C3D|nr:pyridoxamine 5'-phosphate oxidase family protein [Dongshaea marina]
MQDKQQRLKDKLYPQISEFIERHRSMQLATLDARGLPCASYSPFAYINGAFFVLLGDFTQHGQNLKHNQNLGMLIIEDEQQAETIYIRKRVSYQGQASCCKKGSADWSQGVEALVSRFGATLEKLALLDEYQLYRLEPIRGRYVRGARQVFNIDSAGDIEFEPVVDGYQKICGQESVSKVEGEI